MTGYATAHSTQRRSDEGGIAHADRTYCPVACGVHVCGADHDENRFFTVLNIAARSDDAARAMWDAAKLQCAVSKDEGDLVVDLCVAEGIVDDFWTNRQLLPRLQQACQETAP